MKRKLISVMLSVFAMLLLMGAAANSEPSAALLAEEEITVVVDGEVMRDRAFTVRLSEKRVNFFYPAGACYLPNGGPFSRAGRRERIQHGA